MIKRGKIKKPTPEKGKMIKSHEASDLSPQLLPPIFSFEYLGVDKKFSLEQCNQSEKAQFIEKLSSLSKMTWAEIQSSHRHGLGCEKILTNQITGKIPDKLNLDFFFSF